MTRHKRVASFADSDVRDKSPRVASTVSESSMLAKLSKRLMRPPTAKAILRSGRGAISKDSPIWYRKTHFGVRRRQLPAGAVFNPTNDSSVGYVRKTLLRLDVTDSINKTRSIEGRARDLELAMSRIDEITATISLLEDIRRLLQSASK